MNTGYKILMLFFSLLFTGCLLSDEPKINLLNNSDNLIDSIYIFATEGKKTIFKNINPNEKKVGVISFKNVPKTDGAYVIQVFNKGNIQKEVGLGYYTNGASLNYGFDIVIENDTVIVNSY